MLEKTNESFANDHSLARSMSLVYFWMILGFIVTSAVAYFVWQNPLIQNAILFNNHIFYALLVLQLAMIFIFALSNKSAGFLLKFLMYFTYSAMTGMTLSIIFLAFKFESIVSVLISTSCVFLGLCIFGYTTHRDLKRIGTFCFGALLGLIALSLLYLFIPSFRTNTINMLLNIAGVIIFSGLTAYDTQRIKKNLVGKEISLGYSISYALSLYLDLLNLLLKLLALFGKKK